MPKYLAVKRATCHDQLILLCLQRAISNVPNSKEVGTSLQGLTFIRLILKQLQQDAEVIKKRPD